MLLICMAVFGLHIYQTIKLDYGLSIYRSSLSVHDLQCKNSSWIHLGKFLREDQYHIQTEHRYCHTATFIKHHFLLLLGSERIFQKVFLYILSKIALQRRVPADILRACAIRAKLIWSIYFRVLLGKGKVIKSIKWLEEMIFPLDENPQQFASLL